MIDDVQRCAIVIGKLFDVSTSDDQLARISDGRTPSSRRDAVGLQQPFTLTLVAGVHRTDKYLLNEAFSRAKHSQSRPLLRRTTLRVRRHVVLANAT